MIAAVQQVKQQIIVNNTTLLSFDWLKFCFCLWLVKWSKCLLQCLWFLTSVLTWCVFYRVNLPGDAHTEPVLVPPKARRSRAFCASADMKNCRIVQLHRTTFFFFFSKTTWPPTRKPQSTSFLFLR